MPLKPITKSRLSEAAIDQIKELIATRELEPGSKLPSERELVEQLGISRASVREALRALEIIGLVEVKPGKGTFVKGLTGDLFVPLPNWLSDHKETLDNHFEARLVLEPAAAGLAALRASEQDIRRLKGALSAFSERLAQNDLIGLIKSDIYFHSLLGAATGNKTIKMLMDTITRFLFDGWKATLRVKGRPSKTLVEHGEILEAIIRRDEKAAKVAMERHLKNAISNLKEEGFQLKEK
jgi:GntR family transcriptional regulator, transcriptional repressor for pyruvate dehydrogenase complex